MFRSNLTGHVKDRQKYRLYSQADPLKTWTDYHSHKQASCTLLQKVMVGNLLYINSRFRGSVERQNKQCFKMRTIFLVVQNRFVVIFLRTLSMTTALITHLVAWIVKKSKYGACGRGIGTCLLGTLILEVRQRCCHFVAPIMMFQLKWSTRSWEWGS